MFTQQAHYRFLHFFRQNGTRAVPNSSRSIAHRPEAIWTRSEAAALPEVTAVSPISESLERKVTAALTKKKEIVGRRQTTKSRTEPSPGPAPQTDAGRHPLSAKRDKDALPAPLQVIPRRRFPFDGPRGVDPLCS